MTVYGGRTIGDRTAALAVVLLAIALFLPSVTYEFVYDDVYVIRARALLHSLANWREILTAPWWDHALYRPLTQIMFAVEWSLGDGSPVVFHAVNVLCHGVVTLLVFVLARRVIGDGAWIAAAVFAVHPLHVEAVANVVGRAELLSALFALLSVLAYDLHGLADGRMARWKTSTLGFGSLLALVAGLASKESAFATPGLLLMVDWFRALRVGVPFSERMRHHAPLWFASVLVAGAWMLVRAGILGDLAGDFPAPGLEGLTVGGRLVVMAPVVLQYVRLFFFPLHLSADYSPNAVEPAESWTAAGVVGLLVAVGVAAAAIRMRRRSPAMLFAAAWTGASLLIVANLIVLSGVVLAERTLYMASVGPGLFLGWGATRILRWNRVVGVTLVTVALVAGVVRSATRAPVWSEEEILARSILFDAPRSYRAMWIASSIAYDRGDLALADSLLRGAVVIFPLHTGLWQSLADVARAKGQWAEAARFHVTAYRVLGDRGFPVVAYPLADATAAYLAAGMLDSAAAIADELLTRHPETRDAKIAQSDVLVALGGFGGARWLRVQVALESGRWQDWWLATDAALADGWCEGAARSMDKLYGLDVPPATLDSLRSEVTKAGC